MQVKYNGYPHAVGEVGVAFSKTSEFNQFGIEIGVRHTWAYSAVLLATNSDGSDLAAKVAALEAAYSVHGADAYMVDGSNNVVRQLLSARTLGGVRVVQKPTFPKFEGNEWGNFVTYTIVLEAVVPNFGPEAQLLEWNETLTVQGTGGPRWIYLEPLYGPLVRQQVAQCTPVKIIQAGSAVGYFGRPLKPPPLFPQYEHEEVRNLSNTTPVRQGFGANAADIQFATTWQYNFEAPAPLGFEPTARPLTV